MNNEKGAVKINSLELENVKRVKAVKLQPTENGLTVLGGKNAQGKTSVLDAIAWALGGEKKRPSEPHREGSMTNPYLRVELNNGLIVERAGKNSSLKVSDPSGKLGSGQSILSSFVSDFALDLPKFLGMNNKEKAAQLLKIIGVGDKLDEMDKKEEALMNRRREIGRIRDQKVGAAKDMTWWDGVPETPVTASELIQEQQAILARNGENQKKRNHLNEIRAKGEQLNREIAAVEHQISELTERIAEYSKIVENKKKELEQTKNDEKIATTDVSQLVDESTAELEAQLAEIDAINAKVRDNLAKQKAQEEANEYERQYTSLTGDIENIREARMKLLDGSKMPLDGLSVEDGELIYNGQKWDNMSSAEQMIVSTAIVKELKPECGFVLLDKLEQMDVDTLNEFGSWLEAQGLQAIATRVSTGGECSVIIEDGISYDLDGKPTTDTTAKPIGANREHEPEPVKTAPTWKAGEF